MVRRAAGAAGDGARGAQMHYFEGLLLREVGQVFGVSEARICQIRLTAPARLRRRLGRALLTERLARPSNRRVTTRYHISRRSGDLRRVSPLSDRVSIQRARRAAETYS